MSTSSSMRQRMAAAAMVLASGAAGTGVLAAAPAAAAADPTAPPPGITDADARDGAVAALVIDEEGRPTLVEVEAPTVAKAKREAARVPGSDAVVLDTPVTAAAVDPLRSRQWHLDRLRTDSLPSTGDRRGSLVAVVDSGVLATHEDFALGQVLCSRGVDLTSEHLSSDGCTDPSGHGTHVAGIVGAVAGNGRGGSSVAPGTPILPVRVLDSHGSGGSFAVSRGIVYAADQGATVINLSLGSTYASAALDAAVQYATDKGALVVAAAGNNRADGNAVNYPAASPGAVSVASVGSSGISSSFSYSGPTVDLAAPGAGIISTWSSSSSSYASASGTSMAAPVVSAVAALYRASHPDATAAQLAAELLRTADDLEAPGRDNNTGAGMVDPTEVLATSTTPPATPVAKPVVATPAPVVKAPAPRVQVGATRVAKKRRIPLVLSDYKPGSTVTVTETYRVGTRVAVRSGARTVLRTRWTTRTARIASFQVRADGTARAAVLPLQRVRNGTLTVWGLDRAGKAVPTTAPVQVG